MRLSPLRMGALGIVVLLCCAGALFGLAPRGVAVLGPTGWMLGLSTGVALLSLGLTSLTYRRLDAPSWHAHRATLVITSIVAIGITVKATEGLSSGQPLSAELVRAAPELGPGVTVLRANLDQATVITPNRPHSPNEVTSPERRERMQRTRSFSVSTNSKGLRGPEFTSPATRQRVVCIGESVTMGWGVADDQTYPAHLAGILGVEVINAGMPAMNPNVIADWLKANAEMLDMDILVIAVRPNHAKQDPWADYGHALKQAVAAVAPAKVAVVLPPLSTFDPLRQGVWQAEATRVPQIADGHPVLDLTPALRARQQSGVVMQMDGKTQQMCVLPSMSVVAQGVEDGDHLSSELIRAFEDDLGLKEPMFFDGVHPDAAGHKLMANEVARMLQSQGWITPVSP